MNLNFTKMHGAGNDFVVVEQVTDEVDWCALAVAVCNRHFGIGADGLLVVTSSQIADLGMRIFNADGSEAMACGNGLRCVVEHYFGTRYPGRKDGTVTVETRAGLREAIYRRTGTNTSQVRVTMGIPCRGLKPDEGSGVVAMRSVRAADMIMDLDIVSLGNLHAVHFVESPARRISVGAGRPCCRALPSVREQR